MAASSASSCTYATMISSDALSMHFSITLEENFCMDSIATYHTAPHHTVRTHKTHTYTQERKVNKIYFFLARILHSIAMYRIVSYQITYDQIKSNQINLIFSSHLNHIMHVMLNQDARPLHKISLHLTYHINHACYLQKNISTSTNTRVVHSRTQCISPTSHRVVENSTALTLINAELIKCNYSSKSSI